MSNGQYRNAAHAILANRFRQIETFYISNIENRFVGFPLYIDIFIYSRIGESNSNGMRERIYLKYLPISLYKIQAQRAQAHPFYPTSAMS